MKLVICTIVLTSFMCCAIVAIAVAGSKPPSSKTSREFYVTPAR